MRALRVVVIVVVLGLLLACGVPYVAFGIWRGTGPFARIAYGYTAADLARLPEATLFPPGAQLLGGRIGGDGERSLVHQSDAFTGQVFGTSLTPDEVRRFYFDQLLDRGWQPCRMSLLAQWCKGNLKLEVEYPIWWQREDRARYEGLYPTIRELRITATRRIGHRDRQEAASHPIQNRCALAAETRTARWCRWPRGLNWASNCWGA